MLWELDTTNAIVTKRGAVAKNASDFHIIGKDSFLLDIMFSSIERI